MKKEHFEATAVFLTGAGKILFVNLLDQKFWFITVCGTGWLVYLLVTFWRDREMTRRWGFQQEGFRKSIWLLAGPAFLVVIASWLYGSTVGHAVVSWHLIPVLLLYPIWGTIQQWLLISLFGGNLLKTAPVSKWFVYLITAILFGVIHYPSNLLMIGTFLLAFTYLTVFERQRNLLALGLYHGWLGGVFYFFALGRDPWVEFIEKL
jgi:hypothetical protein